MKFANYISLIVLMLMAFGLRAQTDTVCVTSPVGSYHVQGWTNSTFTWNAFGDGIITGQGNDSISVEWTAGAGNYLLTVFETSVDGCDGPLQTLNIVVLDLQSTTDVVICSNQIPYNWNGVDYNTAGTYTANLLSITGCDSIATLNLNINDVLTSTANITICSNQVPYNWNGVNYNAAGTYTANLISITGCDSIATLNLNINDVLTSTISVTICSNQIPYNWNGIDYTAAGTYTADLLTVAGCDSIATLNLNINDVLTSTTDITICSNQIPYTWNGVDYTAAGTYTANLLSITGCDSIATLNLNINDVLTSTTDITICSNQIPYNWNGVDYTAGGAYTANLLTVAGCDSIATLNLSVNDVLTSTTDITICSNQVPYNWNGVDYSAAGTYTANLLTVAGCDSIASLNLNINDVLTSTTDITICSNQIPYNWNGVDYTAAGTYTANLLTVAGCDSIATLNLSINDVLTSTTDITICSNQVPYNWNGVDYNAAGTYTANLLTVAGCDSIATLNLNINDVLTSTIDITVCSNQIPYNWNGVDYNAAGTYTTNLLTVAGCDSIATLNLSINDVLTSTTNITICSNQVPYNWNGVDYTAAGTYTANLLTVAGCDSIAILNLNINDVLTSTTDITICSNQIPYNWNGVSYSAAGTYTTNLLTVAGCDSIATLNLNINDVLTSTTDITICGNQVPYNWNGVDYTAAGTYTANLLTVAGCDSIATLNLNINDVLTSTTNITICSNQIPYTWNGDDYTAAGTYTANLLTVAGCDSIATLNLNINDVLTSTTEITICSNQIPYPWNGVDYNTAGTYTANLLTVAGCDSIATLNLNINDVLASTTDITICSNQIPYNWNGVDYTAAGTYTANLLTVAGCDSIATLNLNINDVLTSTTDITICSNQVPYNWNGVDYNAAGTYTANLLTVAGCDSIATLNLNINDVLTSTTEVTICSNQVPYNWNGVNYSAAGIYTANLLSVTGCDSIATLNLNINDVLTSTTDVTICSNQIPYNWNGVSYSAAGTYTANLLTVAGCDSIATLNLNINDVLTSTTDITICSNQIPYNWNGVDYNTAGTYTANLLSITGCDSIATLNLNINDVLTSTTNITICSNQIPYNWNGVDYSAAGTYTANLLTVAGCDSIASLNLNINDVLTSTTDITICSNQIPYNWNGVNYNTAGTYTANLLTVAGCDSIATLNLNINDVLTSTTDITICSNQVPYNWNGVDYTAAGTYTANLLTVAGCDSIATLNLNINDVLTSTTNITICSNQIPYSWNGVDYSAAGTYTANLLTVEGCDSIATLNLNINDVLTSTTDVTICNNQVPYNWNGVDYNAAGTYTANLLTVAGCDSIATLNLNINDVLTSTTDVTICNNQVPYNWNGVDYTAAGTYTANLLSITGCDSIASLNLNINDVLTSTTDITICSNQIPFNWNGVDYSAAGTYTANLLTVAGCDSIATLNLNINDVLTSTTDVTICSNQVPYNWNGVDYTAAGMYTSNLLTVAGCDSIATLNLLINDVLTSTTDITICSNQIPYTWNGVDYTAAGTYTANLLTVAGCDSIATLNLSINDVLTSTTDITICSNQVPYNWNGVDYNAAGTYTASLLTVAGCDSIATLNLNINDVLTSTTDITICSNQIPYNWNGVDYTAAGTYIENLLTVVGCDSIVTLNLSINDVLTSTTDITICSNQIPYNWNGVDYNATGTYTANLLTVAGCDSTATLNLSINDVLTSTTNITICSNQIPYSWNGVDYNAAGTYTANLLTVAGCDSIATLNLNINDVLTSTTDITICSNQIPYNWNGVDYNAPGTYTSNLLSITGCDSIATLNLNINDVLTSTTDITICSNQIPYNWNGVDYNAAGTYTANLLTVAGCDSIASLNLNINDVLTSTTDITICSNQIPFNWNGVDYSAAGTYTANLLTVAGCDSIATLNLNINDVLTSTTDVTICSNQVPYNWNGVDYTAAGTYTANLLTVEGCDSIATLNLNINDVLTSTTDVTICSNQIPYNWNGVDYNAAGTYTANLLTVAGCDSIATLNLNINDVLTSTTDITICSNQIPYNWNGVDYTAAGTYTANLLTVAGCDSIATLNLNINDVLTSTTDITICSNQIPYTWNGVDYNAAGTYTANLLSITGCDSIATLNLNINDVLTSTIDITICSNQIPYNWNGVDYSAAGTYTANLLTVAGCDSIATLNLNINDVLTSTTDINICSNQIPYNWNGVDYTATGTYTSNLLTVAGCDSIATLNLNINDVLTSTTDITICSNQVPYNWNGVDYTAAGTYTANLLTVVGCDSIATLNLNISPSYFTTESITINEGQSYTLPNGSVVSSAGTYTSNLITTLGCDSIITTSVTVLGAINVVVNASICQGEFYTLPDGSTVAGSGSFVVTLQAASGADSTITTILTEHPVSNIELNEEICQGESWTLPDGAVVTASGVYTSNLTSVFGCDSTIITNLIVNPLPSVAIINNTGSNTLTCALPSISLTATGGGSYFWSNGLGSNPLVNITSPGNYSVTVTLPSGCSASQSITILEDNGSPTLTLSTSNNETELTCDVPSINITASGQGSVVWSNGLGSSNTISVTSPGVYSATITSANGCVAQGSVTITQDIAPPIVAITNLTGTNTLTCDITNITLSASGVGTYIWSPNGGTSSTIGVNTPGEYSVTVTGPNGCSASESYTVLQNIIPPVAGLTNLTGDSILTCDLLSIDLIASGGQGYVWTTGQGNNPAIAVTSAGVYTVMAVGQNGCTDQESVTIYQDINEPEPTIVNVEICEGEAHLLPNDQSVFESGTYNVILNAYNGCDSLIITNLIVHPNHENFFAVRICPGEIYSLPNGQSVSAAGNYPVMFESIHGCDSLVTFVIDIIQTFNIVQNVVICPGESYQLPDGTEETSEGAYQFSYTSSLGCDSIVTYFLDIYNPIVTTIPVTLCNGESYVLPTGQTVVTAGNYPQILQSVAGCDSTVITQISVLPTLQSFVSTTICQGNSYLLPNGQSVSQSGTYSSIVTSANGCDSTVVTTLNIQPAISVAFVPFADTVNVCSGDSVLLNAIGANAYSWSPNDYLTPISSASAEAEPPTSMWYYVTGNTGPCVAQDSLFVNVVQLPNVAITSSELTICQGDSALISATGAEYYSWSPPLNGNCITCDSAFATPDVTTNYTLQGYANGCYNSTSFTLEVMQAALASVNGDTVVCENSPLQLSASGGNSYLWNTGETTSSIEVYPLNDTTYSVVVTLGNCVDSAFFDIYVAPFENVYAGEDTLITLGSSAVLNASGASEFNWTNTESLSCNFCATPTAAPIETTEYCVTGTDLWGCTTEDCVKIEVTIECETFFAPNVFAPNEGGHVENDCYKIYGTECFDTFNLSIYNRWGELVFETENKEDCWDGTYRGQEVNSGVFVYQLNGVLVTGQEFARKGNITLVR